MVITTKTTIVFTMTYTTLQLFQYTKASIYGSIGAASLTHLAFCHLPSEIKQTNNKNERRSVVLSSSSLFDETTDQDNTVSPLRYLGDNQLMQRQPAVTKEQIQSAEFQNKLAMLPKAMKRYGGIGIAAPQVGWWTRVFCFGIDGTNPRYPIAENVPLITWINPKITWSSEDSNWMWEGCLSVPGMRGWVERPSEVVLSGWNETGEEREPQLLKGLSARIAQHELDHLDGILFPHCVPNQDFLIPQASMEARDSWAHDWPSPGSHKTLLGELCDEK